jgi:hypothetical protein
MEAPTDRLNREVYSQFFSRGLVMASVGFVALSLLRIVRPRILPHIPGSDLRALYVTVTSTIFAAPAILGVFGAVVGYYFRLRNKMVHTSLTELGLALRFISAGLVGILAVGLVFAIIIPV